MSQLSAPVQILSVEGKNRNTKNGQKTVYDVKASDGKTYSTWEAPLGQKANSFLTQTVVLSFKIRESNGYTNYDLLDVLSAPEGSGVAQSPVDAPQAVSVAPTAAQSHPVSDKDRQIARAVAIKAALEFAGDADPYKVAQDIEQYVLTGKGPSTVGEAKTEPAQAGSPGELPWND